MIEQVPEKLNQAAIPQLVSGLVNVFMVSAISWFSIGTVCGVCTIWAGGLGGVCGLAGCMLIPIGIFEIVAGAMGLSDPKSGGPIMKYASYAEMVSIVFGGVPSAVVGFLVNRWLSEPEIVAYIEAD